MTKPIPPSWQTPTDWTIDDWLTVHGSPSETIFWVEVTEKFSPGATETHINQPATGEMVFLTNYESVDDQDTRAILELSILGGYDSGGNVMWTPWSHPQNPNLYATSIAIKPAYVDNTNTPGSGDTFPYRVAVCRIGFQSLPYQVTASQGDLSFNPNWIEQRVNAVNQAFTSPVGTYVFQAGPQDGQQAALGTFYTGGLVYWELVLHRIPWDLFAADFLQDDYCGVVNSAPFFGFDAGELFLQSADMGDGPFGDSLGNIVVNGHLHFIYNPNKWNTSLASDGNWYAIGAADGGAPPIDSDDFNTLLADIIPMNG